MASILETFRDASAAVRRAVEDLDDWSGVAGEGADGRPTLRVDEAAEEAALGVVEDLDARVVSEERGAIGDGDGLVVMDPLDGTGNAVNGIPFYSFSAAYFGERPVALVRDLVHGDRFTYSNGVSRMDGREISVSGTGDLSDASISLYTYGTEAGSEVSLGARRTRTLGSAALELCYVASGRLDGMASLREGLSPTDYAAGRLIVEGAGGVVETRGEVDMERVDRKVDLIAGPPGLVTDIGRWVR